MATIEDARPECEFGSDYVPAPGALIDIHGVRYRLLAYVNDRVLLTNAANHNPWLVQEADGSIQLPMETRLSEMLSTGVARGVEVVGPDFTPTEKLRYEIDLLDANDVRQGDKSIWVFLVKAWTPDLVDRFGPHDDPWRIRRWRAALRKAAEERPAH